MLLMLLRRTNINFNVTSVLRIKCEISDYQRVVLFNTK